MSKFLGVEEPDFSAVGDELADTIKERINSAPGDRWNKTGRLLNSITAVNTKDGMAVVAGSDRLQRDDLAQKFADEILTSDLDEETRAAIAKAIFGAFTVDKP